MNEKESNRRRRLILWGRFSVGWRLARRVAGRGFFSRLRHRLVTAAPPIGKQEADAILAALKPPKRQRPLIAIVGINDATEATDYLMLYGILLTLRCRGCNAADN